MAAFQETKSKRILYCPGTWSRVVSCPTKLSSQEQRYIAERCARWGEPTQFLQSVHQHGLVAHGWTFKNEWDNLYWQNGQDPYSELEEFLELGLDGFFTDFPLTAR